MCGKYNAAGHMASANHLATEAEHVLLATWVGTTQGLETMTPASETGVKLPTLPQRSANFGPVFAKASLAVGA